MIVSRHAVRRLKDHHLVPKKMDGHTAKEYIRRGIRDHTICVYTNKKTGATVRKTDRFVAVMYRGTVVTVYPNGGDLARELREMGRVSEQSEELWPMSKLQSIPSDAQEELQEEEV